MTVGPQLPDAVRTRVVALAADCLGDLEPAAVPGQLRAIARFTPRRRAKAVTPIATALETDDAFRAAVAGRIREQRSELVAALDGGAAPAAADPVEVAAVGWLVRIPGWESLVEAAAEATAATAAVADAAITTRLREQLEATRATGRAETARLRAELAGVRSELDRARAEVRREQDRAVRADAAAQAAEGSVGQATDRAAAAARAAEAEGRRLRGRVADAERTLEAARRAGREGRAEVDARLRLLIDALVGAAQGLARELALPPVSTLPGDTIAGASPPASAGRLGWTGAGDDPGFLSALLAVPAVHLVVDGYNVTKTGYGELSLEQQRTRLLTGLGGLAARTQAEVTCVFDGAGQPGPIALGGPRSVRVLFSDPGITADEVIRRLVAAEPAGRPVVVVSADREVAEGVARTGVTAVPSIALIRLLEGRGDAGR